ncbi:hypothetical protein NHX12_019221 [Muraenolepis orangiensis]|uniref:Uncharacterized protein n=1 Tax=Muraenolepis orangiensis TaxID=630683 RepID=A0A9Q0ETH8_9TELE|nr:hypothetical protein NHX12_019221 [Muraenolepis orangiensis]
MGSARSRRRKAEREGLSLGRGTVLFGQSPPCSIRLYVHQEEVETLPGGEDSCVHSPAREEEGGHAWVS